jgi:hypothetical protein
MDDFIKFWSINTVCDCESGLHLLGITHNTCKWTEWADDEEPTIQELYQYTLSHECKETN